MIKPYCGFVKTNPIKANSQSSLITNHLEGKPNSNPISNGIPAWLYPACVIQLLTESCPRIRTRPPKIRFYWGFCWDFIDVIKTILENEQYTVVTAVNKTEGLEQIKAEKPDLAILDVMMDAWQDGFELSRQLKKEPQLKNIPILMLTGVDKKTGIDFQSTAPDLFWLSVDVYMDKPVEPQVLLTEVKKLLSNKAENGIGI